jgi:hypothetical protein
MKGKNPWMIHLSKFRKEHPKMANTEVMKKARVSYKPKGGK